MNSPTQAARMHAAFYAEQLYYLPQFLPVIAKLREAGHRVTVLLRFDATVGALFPSRCIPGLPDIHLVGDGADAYALLRRLAPDWTVFGSFIDDSERLASGTRTALIYHGIGVKNVLFDPRLDKFDLRCVESQRVFSELVERAPEIKPRLALVGFAKLDPLFGSAAPPPPSGNPPTLIYAPTFYPSSLELMPKDLSALLPGARWIVKPHFFTWTIDKYRAQRRRLELWARQPNVEVLGGEHYNLVPLMAASDVLVSDASSALFEFAALRRPVVWCRFQKLRWNYRGIFSWRLDQRIDPQTSRYEAVASCVDRAAEMPAVLQRVLGGPYTPTPQQEELVEYLIGPRDGRVSERIVAELERRTTQAQ